MRKSLPHFAALCALAATLIGASAPAPAQDMGQQAMMRELLLGDDEEELPAVSLQSSQPRESQVLGAKKWWRVPAAESVTMITNAKRVRARSDRDWGMRVEPIEGMGRQEVIVEAGDRPLMVTAIPSESGLIIRAMREPEFKEEMRREAIVDRWMLGIAASPMMLIAGLMWRGRERKKKASIRA